MDPYQNRVSARSVCHEAVSHEVLLYLQVKYHAFKYFETEQHIQSFFIKIISVIKYFIIYNQLFDKNISHQLKLSPVCQLCFRLHKSKSHESKKCIFFIYFERRKKYFESTFHHELGFKTQATCKGTPT